ncbi:MAG: hypothetical protein ACI32C_02630 [Candidatus Enteromonas sp.]
MLIALKSNLLMIIRKKTIQKRGLGKDDQLLFNHMDPLFEKQEETC